MRILLIATNRHDRLMSRMVARPLPIGLAYVAGHLDPTRHSLKVLDLMFSDDYLAETERAVKEFQPDVVGISLRNLDNQSYIDSQWALPITKEVIQCVRSVSRAPVICGGPAFSILPRGCFDYLEPDLGVAGDAGETFATLADRLNEGETLSSSKQGLPGMVYRENGETVVSDQRSYSAFPKPPRFDELDMSKYDQAGFGIGILTKLTDFYYPTSGSRRDTEAAAWRVIRPIEEVVEETREMQQRFGIKKAFFVDNGFNIPMTHAKALCQNLMEADLKVHWNTCLAPIPESCDEEVLGLMKQAGCSLVVMSGAGGHDDENINLEKYFEPLREVCHRCEENGLHYTISQPFGEPGETEETVEAKLAFLKELSPAIANLRVGVRVLPGSPVARMAHKEGMISDDNELIRPTFYMAESVRGWIVDRLKEEAAQNPRWNLF